MLIFLISLFLLSIYSSNSLKCLDDNKEPVDWLIAYKLPEIKQTDSLIERGIFYMYMTSLNHLDWIPSSFGINSSQSFVKNTLFPYYENKENVSYIFYNDEVPNSRSNNEKGHTKGVVLTNNEGGLWLVHSVPKFPPINEYNFPETGLKFGQSFLCISLDLKNLDEVGKQLMYNEPNIYTQQITSDLENEIPNLLSAAKNNTIKSPPWFHSTMIRNSQFEFYSFGKSKKFGKDLYADWVAPILHCNLLVETWPNSPGRLHSDCTKPYKVKNVKSVFVQMENLSFNSTHDHSKWAICDDNSWTCIGDINRAEHQEVRGGGTVCFRNEKITRNYRKLVKYVEECKKQRAPIAL